MRARAVAVVLLSVAPLFAACGSNTKSGTPEAAPSPTVSDEEQIRALVNEEGDAFADWDMDKVAELTCAQYREEARSLDDVVPPMDMFPAEESAAIGPDQFAELLGQQFTGASSESLHTVADAVIRQDEAAYQTAMLDVVKQIYSVRLEKVEDIKVNGDKATAQTTISQNMSGQPPKTDTSTITLVRENGEWKDCTEPHKQ